MTGYGRFQRVIVQVLGMLAALQATQGGTLLISANPIKQTELEWSTWLSLKYYIYFIFSQWCNLMKVSLTEQGNFLPSKHDCIVGIFFLRMLYRINSEYGCNF